MGRGRPAARPVRPRLSLRRRGAPPGQPLQENWISRAGSEDFARLVDYRDDYQPGRRRFDIGQRTRFELLPMAVAALRKLTTWRVDNVAAALKQVTGQLAVATADLCLTPLPADQRGRARRSRLKELTVVATKCRRDRPSMRTSPNSTPTSNPGGMRQSYALGL
jgi:hypothetical protein